MRRYASGLLLIAASLASSVARCQPSVDVPAVVTFSCLTAPSQGFPTDCSTTLPPSALTVQPYACGINAAGVGSGLIELAMVERNYSYGATGWDRIVVTPVTAVLAYTATIDATSASAVANETYWASWRAAQLASFNGLNASCVRTAMYYAGFVEGAVTTDTISAAFTNMVTPTMSALLTASPTLYAAVNNWITTHRAYMNATSLSKGASDPFWRMVGGVLLQVAGIADGYAANYAAVAAASGSSTTTPLSLTHEDVFLLSFSEEANDVITSVQNFPPTSLSSSDVAALQNAVVSSPRLKSLLSGAKKGSHCSALIKDTGADLFMSHDTWSDFSSMLRQYKVYNFGTTVALSGYPGVVHSVDDWYMTSNRLTVQETTNGVYNTSLYKTVVPQTVSEFIRVMTANYLSTTGQQWTNFASTQNSGTYNNQWMVVDQKLFVPNEPNPMMRIPDGTLWVFEQLPDPFARFQDVSKVLRDTSYWASYNHPYFQSVFAESGYLAQEEAYGSMFSYTKYSRAEIFARDQSSVKGLDDMKRVMRYNNFTREPFTIIPNCTGEPHGVCSPSHSAMLPIASRGDLDPSEVSGMGVLATLGYIGQQNLGAIDSKITSHRMTMNTSDLMGHIICGPTTSGGLPSFNWTWSQTQPAFKGVSHLLHPDVFEFDWVAVGTRPSMPPAYVPPPPPPSFFSNVSVIAGAVVGCCVLVILLVYAVRQRRSLNKGGETAPLTAA